MTAENDPLRDEGEADARKLKEARVSVDAVRYGGTIHDFDLPECASARPIHRSCIEAGQRHHQRASATLAPAGPELGQ
ncbi:MAG: alpha/beta hydrolase fold domain-containing protein [Acetobacteraceae bacterium]